MSFRHFELRIEMLMAWLSPVACEFMLLAFPILLFAGLTLLHFLPHSAWAVPSGDFAADQQKVLGSKPEEIECSFAYSMFMDCYLWGPYPERCPIKQVASKAKVKFFPKYDTTLTADAQGAFVRRFEQICHLGCLLRSRKESAIAKIPLCRSQGIIPRTAGSR